MNKQIPLMVMTLLAVTQIVSAADVASLYQNPKSNYQWVKGVVGQAPSQGVFAGETQGDPLYVCRTKYNNSVYPGEVMEQGCQFAADGKAQLSKNFEILSGTPRNPTWRDSRVLWQYLQDMKNPIALGPGLVDANRPATSFGETPVIAGKDSNGKPVFICRTLYHNAMHIGHVNVSGRKCMFEFQGTEKGIEAFQVIFN